MWKIRRRSADWRVNISTGSGNTTRRILPGNGSKSTKCPDRHPPLDPGDQTMWIIEPSVAEALFDQMAAEAKVKVVRNEQLDRKNGVKMEGRKNRQHNHGVWPRFSRQDVHRCHLRRRSLWPQQVSHISSGGNPTADTMKRSMGSVPNRPRARLPKLIRTKSQETRDGLLPRVHPDWGNVGDGDRGVQAYNYRMCLTKVPENRVPVEKPEGYDEKQYGDTLPLHRSREATIAFSSLTWCRTARPTPITTAMSPPDFVGMSAGLPGGRLRRPRAHRQRAREVAAEPHLDIAEPPAYSRGGPRLLCSMGTGKG